MHVKTAFLAMAMITATTAQAADYYTQAQAYASFRNASGETENDLQSGGVTVAASAISNFTYSQLCPGGFVCGPFAGQSSAAAYANLATGKIGANATIEGAELNGIASGSAAMIDQFSFAFAGNPFWLGYTVSLSGNASLVTEGGGLGILSATLVDPFGVGSFVSYVARISPPSFAQDSVAVTNYAPSISRILSATTRELRGEFLVSPGQIFGISMSIDAQQQANFVGSFRLAPLPQGVTMTSASGAFLSQAVSAGAIPEPDSWMLMIAGFGLVGATARRAKRARATA